MSLVFSILVAERLQKGCRKVAERLQKDCRKVAERLQKGCRKVAEKLQRGSRKAQERFHKIPNLKLQFLTLVSTLQLYNFNCRAKKIIGLKQPKTPLLVPKGMNVWNSVYESRLVILV